MSQFVKGGFITAALLVVTAVVFSGCRKATEATAREQVVDAVEGDAPVDAPRPAVSAAPGSAVAAPWITERFGDDLVDAEQQPLSTAALAGKTVGIYFSAHWCPPCRGFSPKLVRAYETLQAGGKPFEIVFVSSDRSEKQMYSYMKELKMTWPAIPYSSPLRASLSKQYGIRGIPALVVLRPDGQIVTKDGRGHVASKGAQAFADW